jgi:hypothetical protein
MGMECSTDGKNGNGYRMFVGKPEGKRPLVISRHRWVVNIKMDLRERMGWYGLDRSGSASALVESSCEHGNEPSGSIKCWKFLSSCTIGGSQEGLNSTKLVI